MTSGTLVSPASGSRQGINDPRLLGEWLAVAWSREMEAGQLVQRRLVGRDIVLWRSSEGIRCWRDLCVHRGARLSLGQVRNDCLICLYHAWHYDTSGQCVLIPAHPNQKPPLKAHAETYQVRERYGLV